MKVRAETKEMLLFCAQACVNTYQGSHGTPDYRQYTIHKTFDTGDVEFDIGIWQDYVVIAFEGSDGKDDWKHNFDIKKVKFREVDLGENALVHEGFERQYHEAWPVIREELRDKKYIGIRKLLVTGHSLGGALATLCAIHMSVLYPGALVYCITLGAPRVGNWTFARAFNKLVYESYRIENDLDTVCKIPPAWLRFYHVNIELGIGTRSWWEYPLHPIVWTTGNPMDHEPERYMENIKRIKVRK